eukprot:scaffold562_cov235-Prasinococcus_capsulatus_cf.AAC.3
MQFDGYAGAYPREMGETDPYSPLIRYLDPTGAAPPPRACRALAVSKRGPGACRRGRQPLLVGGEHGRARLPVRGCEQSPDSRGGGRRGRRPVLVHDLPVSSASPARAAPSSPLPAQRLTSLRWPGWRGTWKCTCTTRCPR